MSQDAALMRQAVQLAHANRLRGGRPFGAVLTRGSEVLATGINDIIQSHDPSTHAEMQAIRAATQAQKNPSLAGCTIYASGHPCPMCLAALVMTGVEQVFFAFDNNDAAPYNLSSEGTYQRLRLSLNPPPLPIARVDTGITAAQLYGDAPWPEEDMK
ncbi:nucleoside deaminase [Diaphorobacter sp. HDW4B]|nr:nucleoside deaminase [Diaphorobacter sp. HDW4B]